MKRGNRTPKTLATIKQKTPNSNMTMNCGLGKMETWILLAFLILAACCPDPLSSPSNPKPESGNHLAKESPTRPVHLEPFWLMAKDSDLKNPVSIATQPKRSLILDLETPGVIWPFHRLKV